jgi:hypothetical protein
VLTGKASRHKAANVSLIFGATAPPIAFQVRGQGLKITDQDGEFVQAIHDAITLLKIHGYLAEREVERAHRRLSRRVVELVSW